LKLTVPLLILPFLFFSLSYFALQFIFQSQTLLTPNIIGKELHAALQELSNAQLNARILTLKEEPDLPNGTILNQIPKADQKIKSNQTVLLIISKKPPFTIMPDILNKSLSEIEKLTKEKGIYNKIYYLDSLYPSQTCIGQIPLAGTSLSEKKIITYISYPRIKPCIMPNLKNYSLKEVKEFLAVHSIVPEIFHNTKQKKNHSCSNCIVIAQKPLAGSLIHLKSIGVIQLQVKSFD